MSEQAKPGSWWTTLPGILTGLAALLTAVAGLLAAATQAGWFGKGAPPAVAKTTATAPTPSAAGQAAAAKDGAASRGTVVPAETPRAHAVALPAQREHRLGAGDAGATFTLLQAQVQPKTADRDTLRIRLRMTNHGRYDANFWDASFRLLVDGVPLAPEGGLNELVPGDSAREGDVLFALARGTRSATLRIKSSDETTDIPLALAP